MARLNPGWNPHDRRTDDDLNRYLPRLVFFASQRTPVYRRGNLDEGLRFRGVVDAQPFVPQKHGIVIDLLLLAERLLRQPARLSGGHHSLPIRLPIRVSLSLFHAAQCSAASLRLDKWGWPDAYKRRSGMTDNKPYYLYSTRRCETATGSAVLVSPSGPSRVLRKNVRQSFKQSDYTRY